MMLGTEFYKQEDLEGFGFKSLGRNVKIKKNVSIFFTENVSVGNNVRIDDNVILVAGGSDTLIGSNVHIAANCYLAASAGLEMSDFSGLAPGVNIFTGTDDYSGKKLTNPTLPRKYIGGVSGKVTLGRHVIIGSGTVILPNVSIGDGSSVGALCLVTKNLEPWGVYFGVPVKKLKKRSQALLDLEKKYLEEENH